MHLELCLFAQRYVKLRVNDSCKLASCLQACGISMVQLYAARLLCAWQP